MPRHQAWQGFLDVALPAMRARARDGNSPASLQGISEAILSVGDQGAAPAGLPVVEAWLDTALAVPWNTRTCRSFAGGAAAGAAHVLAQADRRCRRQRECAESHANAMLLGPAGIQERRDIWISLSLLAPQTRYPDYQHAPEETYLVLSPGQFRKPERDWFEPGGGSFFVPPNAVHAMRAEEEPLFALWAFRA
ncbi:dimethylsulfonioproprionate lyase family protein (plasmid) [Paracoccus sp. TD-10]|uniref:dimethylsulfonioproprionate lyase family protein n=2 Tax=unclassified Paracoccus (in: a-proteobacteria) TaxID=2688777 RepID=UPI003AAC580D